MKGTVVGILRGGPSREHDVSLKTGHTMLTNLPPEDYHVRDIYIDRQGVWHEHGRVVRPEQILHTVDAILLGLHGEYGEDGEVQRLLERHGVPYTGSDSLGSSLAMHKVLAKERVREAGLLVPRHVLIEPTTDIEKAAYEIVRTFPMPVVVKPVRWGSSVGITFATGYAPLVAAIRNLLASGADMVMVEERIHGTEVTSGVVEHMRGEHIYALPPVEIVPPPKAEFFSYDAKYSGESTELCPARLPQETQAKLKRLAREAHTALGLRHYSRSDFIVSPRGIYYLETNTLPGMTSASLLPRSLAAVGVSLPEFLAHLIRLARNHHD